MSLEANKQLVRRFYASIEKGDFDALHEMVHDDFVFYSQIDTPKPGVQGLMESEKPSFARGVRISTRAVFFDSLPPEFRSQSILMGSVGRLRVETELRFMLGGRMA